MFCCTHSENVFSIKLRMNLYCITDPSLKDFLLRLLVKNATEGIIAIFSSKNKQTIIFVIKYNLALSSLDLS
jgi:hypothetical protein